MKKINSKVLIIPPHISTNWTQVQSLFVKDGILHICLANNERVSISSLSNEDLEKIFSSHAEHLALSEQNRPSIIFPGSNVQSPENIFRFSFGGIDQLGNIMQHNSEQSNIPDLPIEILEKISAVAKVMAPEELSNLPEAEPHCNCAHCQILRAMSGNIRVEAAQTMEEEKVTEEDLRFKQWDILTQSEKIFSVVNPLDKNEEYKVCLDPVGCTCGKEGCEHVIAVLKS